MLIISLCLLVTDYEYISVKLFDNSNLKLIHYFQYTYLCNVEQPLPSYMLSNFDKKSLLLYIIMEHNMQLTDANTTSNILILVDAFRRSWNFINIRGIALCLFFNTYHSLVFA